MKQKFILCALFVAMAVTATADWWETDRIVRGGLEGLGAILASQERQQQAEIFSREKARYEADFNDAYSHAKELEAAGEWERALEEYEQAATLNCQYGYTDQKAISKKITSLYSKAGRDDDGPSILNNSQITLADYSAYRYMQLNPICKVDDKVRNAKIRLYQGEQGRQTATHRCGQHHSLSCAHYHPLPVSNYQIRTHFRTAAPRGNRV